MAVGLAAGGWSGCSWKRKKLKQSAEGRETFMVAYYRRSGGWPMVLATRGDAGCSRAELEEETLATEEERRRSRRRKSAAGRSRRGMRGERRDVCSTIGKRLLVQEKGFCGGTGGGKTSDGVLPVVAVEEGERKTEKQREMAETGKRLIFWLILDPILSSLRPSNPPLFISGGRGQSCLQWRKISALDSDEKDPNRWLKVGMVHC
jgi:hypothetical protein